ncbi:hypothetical protein tpqmel_0810 [Candidatus Gastranaerophilus sp. (ex Termes propinquus)]|nr:hypothetical protein tpqmel_0810 [Candidatus Gastranaerophilus sp. (ex Termes propinquus)]
MFDVLDIVLNAPSLIKLKSFNEAAKNFDERSNFTHKDKKLSTELSSVFDLLINSHFLRNGAGDEARTRDIFLGKEAFYH